MSSYSYRKSERACWMPLGSTTLFPFTWRRASCMWLKRPQETGKTISIDQISPSNWSHLSTPMSFWIVSISGRIYLKWFSSCGGKGNVVLTVSITHPGGPVK